MAIEHGVDSVWGGFSTVHFSKSRFRQHRWVQVLTFMPLGHGLQLFHCLLCPLSPCLPAGCLVSDTVTFFTCSPQILPLILDLCGCNSNLANWRQQHKLCCASHRHGVLIGVQFTLQNLCRDAQGQQPLSSSKTQYALAAGLDESRQDQHGLTSLLSLRSHWC